MLRAEAPAADDDKTRIRLRCTACGQEVPRELACVAVSGTCPVCGESPAHMLADLMAAFDALTTCARRAGCALVVEVRDSTGSVVDPEVLRARLEAYWSEVRAKAGAVKE